MSDHSFVPVRAQKSDEEAIIKLEQLVWGTAEEATLEYLHWCLNDPVGQSMVSIIKDDSGNVLAMGILLCMPAILKGKPIMAGILINGATRPDFRRKGFANQIEHSLLADARSLGIQFLFTLPNSMSGALFTEKTNFKDLGKPLLFVRWIDLGIFVGQKGFPKVGKFISFATKLISRIGPRKKKGVYNIQYVEDLEGLKLQEPLEPTTFCFATDGHWLRWRYREHPFRRYEGAIVGEIDSPQALVVYHVLKSGKRALIMELAAGPNTPLEAVQALMDDVAEKCKAAGCSSMCILGVPCSRKTNLLRKSGFKLFPFHTIWRPRIVVNSPVSFPKGFSLSSMEFSFGALINLE